jgi:hypothetical protein
MSRHACSSLSDLEIPSSPSPPDYWSTFSTSTMPGSDCPLIEGTYMEPPLVHRVGVDPEFVPKDTNGLYSSYIPFYRADREEFSVNGKGVSGNSFTIRQPDETQFYFSYFSEPINLLVEYHFQLDEGDFACGNGQIEFPKITSYGVIEGMSVNFQIKNVLMKDEKGALVIQSTGGPYRGKASQESKKFMFEFIKYLPKND